ncbi:protein CHROMATIN REMODELING 24 isoform X2 [Silene latifolia]|uniref:protein CHROMATIN REMODELING 24 isoform X2 n=1 Tax=Silene latifolia TaxID=37657 RepID=UPI003D78768C
MAETATTKKKPLSLNDRIRLLSASHSRRPPPPPSSHFIGGENFQPSFNLESPPQNDTTDFPRFSGIVDLDSFSDVTRLSKEDDAVEQSTPDLSAIADFDLHGDVTKPLKHNVGVSAWKDDSNHDSNPSFLADSHHDVAKLSKEDNTVDPSAPDFSAIGSFHLHSGTTKLSKDNVQVSAGNYDSDHASNPSFPADTDSNPPHEKPKTEKVKIEGRRRLCKVSTQSNENDTDHAKEESHQFFDVSDFSSPPLGKDLGCGGYQIRDILNDLSSRLEFLSIEKKKTSRTVDLKAVPSVDEFAETVKDNGADQKKDVTVENEYASAGSSFAGSSDQSRSSSEADNGQSKTAKNDLATKFDWHNFGEVTKPSSNFEGKVPQNMGRNVNEKPSVSSRHSAYSFKDEIDIDHGQSKSEVVWHDFAEVTKQSCNLKGKAPRSISRNVVEKSAVSHRQTVYSFKDDFDIDTLAQVNQPRKNVPRKEPKSVSTVFEESAVSHKKTAHKLKNDNDEDDCVEVGSHGWKRAGVANMGFASSRVAEIVDGDEVVLRSDNAFILKDPRSSFELSPKISKMLYPHQREGLKWLWSLHCQGKGGILGDDMGLGKTMQIAGYLAGMFHSRLIKRAMIVAPKTLIPHWIKELSVVGLSKMIKEYFGACPKLRNYELQYVFQEKGILLTTYDIVRNNTKQLCGGQFYDEDDVPLWDYMILDEGHLIKNPSTQRAKSLLEIPCAHRIIISGTPIQNNLKELWALFNFCCPDLLGDKQGFKEKYENPILRGNDKKASERDKRVGSMVAKELRDRIQPYFLRRMKSEVFSEDGTTESTKLSRKNEIIVWLRLTSSQRHLYEAFLRSEIVLSAFDGSPLAAITILKKICDHPYLLTKRAAEDLLEGMDSMLNQEDRSLAEKLATHAANLTGEDDFQENNANVSCKISFILSLLENLIPEGHNVLIFSQTRKMLNLIQESLVTRGFEFLRIDGTTKANDRLKIVNEFQEGHGAPIFLLTSQVGGLGLTLTKADRVIVVDPAWNPSTDNQSVDRAYRIGQKKNVVVYRLITCGTIEEKMYRMQVFKGGLFKTATEHKEQTRYFTQQDLKELFSLPKDGFDISPTQIQLHAEHGDQISMSNDLKDHIKFLESFGIGGVSDHGLLYSKSEPTPSGPIEEEEIRRRSTTSNRHFGGSSTDLPVNGSQYAFKPKEVKTQIVNSSPKTPDNMSESEIKDRIRRLSQLLSNKATVSKLPDKGEKLRKQMSELAVELENLVTPEKDNEIIELDDVADQMRSSLHV